MSVLLLFPPQWNPVLPHLALPALTGFLRAHGVDVTQRDLSIEAYSYFLRRDNLERAMEQSWDHHRRLSRTPDPTPLKTLELEHLRTVLEGAVELVQDVELALQILRGPDFYEPDENLGASLTILDALELASAPYFPTQLGWYGYQTLQAPNSTQDILAAVADARRNMCMPFYEDTILRDMRQDTPDVVGISISTVHQVVPGLTLAAMIKAGVPDTHVVLGGKMVTCWRENLGANAELFQLFDSAVYHDGEQALLDLVQCVASGEPLSSVPNLIYCDASGIHVNAARDRQEVGTLPPPDFDGLPLDGYLTPHVMLPIEACRGCYWQKCAFCNLGYGQSRDYRPRGASQVVDEMAALQQRHGARYFFFVDEAIPPALLSGMAQEITARGLDVAWCTCARFEHALDADLLADLHRAGCRLLNFGLESGSQAVLDSLHKGTDLETISRVLREGAQAGIWNHVFCFFGFPGETRREAEETMRFVREHLDVIGSIAAGTFVMEPGADICEHPDSYAVESVDRPVNADLAFQFDYAVSSGQTPEQAASSLAQFSAMVDQYRQPHVFFVDGYNLLYADHFRDPGVLSRPASVHEVIDESA